MRACFESDVAVKRVSCASIGEGKAPTRVTFRVPCRPVRRVGEYRTVIMRMFRLYSGANSCIDIDLTERATGL